MNIRTQRPLARGSAIALNVEPKRSTMPDGKAQKGISERLNPLLADVLEPNANSFSVMRLVLALAVLISHTIFLARGHHDAEPLVTLTGYSLGQYAVQGFFILSGILVTQSLLTRHDIVDFVRARALRIFPGMIVCVLLTAFVVGPMISQAGLISYFFSTGVPAYVLKTVSLSTGVATLPGLFDGNPVGGAVNQSLWTLKYEVACYVIVGGLAWFFWKIQAGPRVIAGAIAVWALGLLLARPSIAQTATFATLIMYFSLFFGTGVVTYLLRDFIRISWHPLPILAALFVATWHTSLAEIASAAFIGHLVIWLGTRDFGHFRKFANDTDLSYGVYIYSFPVTQILLAQWPGIDLGTLLFLTLVITLVLAVISWELVEQPSLKLARKLRRSNVSGLSIAQTQEWAAAAAGKAYAAVAAGVGAGQGKNGVAPYDKSHGARPAHAIAPAGIEPAGLAADRARVEQRMERVLKRPAPQKPQAA